MNDILAINYLQSLLKNSYLPITSSSISPSNLVYIMNDIVLNKRHNILEFGSGISTILIGRLISQNKLNSNIVSIEHDSDWVNFIQEYIDNENLSNFINLIYSPLNNGFYNLNPMLLNQKFDMVIIDGPPAYEIDKQEARYPTFPFIKDKLNENSIVFIDDADRDGEKNIIKKWENEFNIKFDIIENSFAIYSKGNSFNQC
jgi:predicted O-methyltransferase YrrM